MLFNAGLPIVSDQIESMKYKRLRISVNSFVPDKPSERKKMSLSDVCSI